MLIPYYYTYSLRDYEIGNSSRGSASYNTGQGILWALGSPSVEQGKTKTTGRTGHRGQHVEKPMGWHVVCNHWYIIIS